ncbi:unnamed protein product [Lymnaea stagnalis]|uniref:Translocation protein SEC62 n=1 Tax=Lymnaea stagnalis TaxID=6523 RepID=A0AAV2H4Q0_LYMST
MADKKKGKQRKIEEEKPTKEEYAVAKFLRFNLPIREGKLVGMEVKCFIGNAAVDKLMQSKWSASKNKKDPLFTNRATCVAFMLRLLEKGLFHRAEREKRKKEKDKPIKRKKKEGEKEEGVVVEEELRVLANNSYLLHFFFYSKERKGKKERRSRKEKELEAVEDVEKTKKEKRLKLIMPESQFFEDGDEVYVWIYDPVNAKNFFIGLLMVLGAIALCMFPLWPEEVRIGVYYLSLAAAGFVGFILSLVVVRLILFCFFWVLTFGKHHFWFLPNLTEDVGFFDSFRPLYKHDVMGRDSKAVDIKKKKKKIDKESGDLLAVTESKVDKSSDKDDSDEFELIKKEDLVDNGGGEDVENEDEDEGGEDNECDENDDNQERDEEDEDENNGDDIKDSEEELEEDRDSQSETSKEKEDDKKTK